MNSDSTPVRLLIVDDSAVMRSILTRVFSADEAIEVVGTAANPYEAKDKIIELNPDVLTVDIEMPRMDGLTFLKILMKQRPLPVIVMSSLSHSGSTVAVEALQRGAVDVVGKPMNASEMENFAPLLREKVRAAAISRKLRRRHTLPPQAVSQQRAPTGQSYRARQLICIGASTGGTEAIKDVLQRLPAGLPGIAVVQHIPAGFSRAFADRLNTICAMEVREATHGEILGSGLALVAPGNYHMRLDWTGQHFRVCLDQSAPIWHQRPAVDALFESAAKAAGGEACGVILTGMGRDGAAGLAAMRKAGAQTFAQDEATSVVYGMPRVAWESGAAGKQVALGGVSRAIIQSLGARRMSAA